MMNKKVLSLLRCPISGQPLHECADGTILESADGQYCYPVVQGIAMLIADYALLGKSASSESKISSV